MQQTPPDKVINEYLLDNSNVLYPFLAELQRNHDAIHRDIKSKSPKLPKVDWSGRTGNSEGKVIFPEGTILVGNFRNFRLTEGSITFPTGLRFKGRFRCSDSYFIDIFQSGTITFADGTYAKVDFENLKLKRVEVFDKSNTMLGRVMENETLTVRPKTSGLPKRMDLLTFTEESLARNGCDSESVTYSYFGLYIQKERPPVNNTAFFARNPGLVNLSSGTNVDFGQPEIETIAKYKNDDDSILRFEIQGFPGRFLIFVDDPENPNYGSGYFLLSDFSCPVTLLPLPPNADPTTPHTFMLRNRPHTVSALKQTLRRLIDEQVMRKFNTSEFHDLEQTKFMNSREAEFQQNLNRMIRKYESLQKQVDTAKSEHRAKINHIVNINNALQRKNEELIASELDARNSRHKIEADIQKIQFEMQAINKEASTARLAGKAEADKQRLALAECQTTLRRTQTDLEGLKISSKAKIDLLTNEKTELLAKIKRADDECVKLSNFSERLKEESVQKDVQISGLRDKLNNLERQLAAREVAERELKLASDKFRGKAEDAERETKLLEADRTRLMKELEASKAKCESMAEEKRLAEESKGTYFSGTMKDGRKIGHCIFETATAKYEGLFANDKLNGEGTMTLFANQKVLQGECWSDGVFGGKSCCVGLVKYRGGIVGNCLQGKGFFEFLNGFNLEATFNKDEIDDTKDITLIDLSDGSETKVRLASDRKTLVSGSGKKWAMNFKDGNLIRVSSAAK